MNKKFELITDDCIEHAGKKLYRIRALRDFGYVKAGEVGGYIEKEENLSHDGNSWVYDDAFVFSDARIFDNAQVGGDAQVYDHAQVYDRARVCGHAKVCGHEEVSSHVRMCGNAKVSHATLHGQALQPESA